MERAQELFLARLNLLLFWMHGGRFSLWRSAAARFLPLCLMPLTSFIQGLATTRGLIVAIGAQNAFVLRQALDALIGLLMWALAAALARHVWLAAWAALPQ